ncbi:MAG: hypothetical protein ABFC71_07140 [Methanoregula sp.]
MESIREHDRLLALIPAIVLWGCFGGICLAAVSFFLQGIWSPVLAYNYALLSPVFQFQIIGSFAVLLWVLAVIAADLFSPGRYRALGPVLIGMVSGTCTALVFTSILVIHDMISHPPILHYAGDPFLIRVFLDGLFHQWLIPLAGFILISTIIQAMGAYFRESRRSAPQDDMKTPDSPAITKKLPSYRFLLLGVLAVLIIPPSLLYLGMSTGVIAEQPRDYAITDSVDVTRTAPDSVQIVMKPDPNKVRRTTSPLPSVQILLGEKDVSNRSIITESGLDDTIKPSEGLLYRNGASVILRGKDASANDTVPVRLVIIVTYPDTGERAIICDRDI